MSRIKAPTQITVGGYDHATSTRFAEPLHQQIKGSELHLFEDCPHAPIYENAAAFNEVSLAFLRNHS